MNARHLGILLGSFMILTIWSVTDAQMGGMMNNSGMMHGGRSGQFAAWDTVTVSGTVLVDTLGFHDRYLLDEDGDGEADDYLGFGPWWYQPEGVSRPASGDAVIIEGLAATTRSGLRMIMVLEINGQVWRDPDQPPPWAACRLRREATGATVIRPGQGRGSMTFPEGSMVGMMMDGAGMMMDGVDQDEMYIHMEEVGSDEIPDVPSNKRVIAAYRVGFSNAIGEDMMERQQMMEFARPVEVRLGYDRADVQEIDRTRPRLTLIHMNENGDWTEVGNAVVDEISNEVTVSAKRISSYYALVIAQESLPTAVESATWGRIKGIFR